MDNLEVYGSVANDVEEDGREVYGQEVTEESAAKNDKDKNSGIVAIVNLGHVGTLDVVLGELNGTEVAQLVNLQLIEIVRNL